MIDLEDFDLPDPPAPPGEMGGGVFDQADIDALFGDVGPIARKSGLRAVIESKVISHERLPMLEVVCDRVVRSFASSMRNLTSDGVDVSLEEVTSTRFGEFMNRVALPAMVGVFKIEEWESTEEDKAEPPRCGVHSRSPIRRSFRFDCLCRRQFHRRTPDRRARG